MSQNAESFRRNYAQLSDEALLEIDPEDLIPEARAALDEEIGKRGLDAETEDSSGQLETIEADGNAEELVCVAEFEYPDEIAMARGLLSSANIATTVQGDGMSSMNLMGSTAMRLMVLKSMEEQALEVLASSPLTDEELAEQAEAFDHPDAE